MQENNSLLKNLVKSKKIRNFINSTPLGKMTKNRLFQVDFFKPKTFTKLEIIAKILIGIVAIEHVYLLWLEMFAWTTKAPEIFKGLKKELFEPTKALAANQGLYNGFLAAG